MVGAKHYKIHYIEEETQRHMEKIFTISSEYSFHMHCLKYGIIEVSRVEVGTNVYLVAPSDKKVNV